MAQPASEIDSTSAVVASVSGHHLASESAPGAALAEMPGKHALGDTLYDMLGRFGVPALLGLVGLLATCAVLSSAQKHLWYDEVFTVIVATRPTWHNFLQAMPPEGNPPLNTVLTRLCMMLFGHSDSVVRLPNLAGFLFAVIGVYVFVRREVGATLGILAATLVMAEPAWEYSFEARPYGVLLACLTLAMVSWQAATRVPAAGQKQPRALALLGLAIGIVGCILSHHIGILEVAVPLVAGEAVRSLRNRRLDWPLLATGLVALPALAVVVPMMRRTSQVVIVHAHIWEPPLTLAKLHAYYLWAKGSYRLVLSSDLLITLSVALIVSWVPGQLRRSKPVVAAGPVHESSRVPPHIFAAALGAALLIPITWLAMLAARGWYFCRYGIGSVVGIAILTCMLLGASRRPNKVLVIFLLAAGWISFAGSFHTSWQELRMQKHSLDVVFADSSQLPLVVSSPFDLPQVWWYAPALTRDRLVYLPYTSGSVPQLDLLQATLLAERPAIGHVFREYGQFLSTTPHFLLDVGTAGEPLQEKLAGEGCLLTQKRAEGVHRIFDVRCDTPAFARKQTPSKP